MYESNFLPTFYGEYCLGRKSLFRFLRNIFALIMTNTIKTCII